MGCEIDFRLIPQNLTDDKSTLDQVNGFVPSDNMQFPKQMLTKIYGTIWHC